MFFGGASIPGLMDMYHISLYAVRTAINGFVYPTLFASFGFWLGSQFLQRNARDAAKQNTSP